MKQFSYCIFCLTFLVFSPVFARKSTPQTLEHRVYRVIKVIDGDTIKLENGQLVRLIGIDAPETKQGLKLDRDLKQRRLSKKKELAMGRRAWQFTKSLVEGRKVRLEFDRQKYDDYQRILAYVYLANGSFVNAEILKAGYAYTSTIKPDIRYSTLFGKLYMEAKEEHRGLWQQQIKPRSKAVRWFKDN